MSDQISPLAPAGFPAIPPVAGVAFATAESGIRYRGRADVMVALLAPGTTIAGLFTRNKMPGAPVDWCRKILPQGRARIIVTNAGNANVFTGAAGRAMVEETAAAAAAAAGCDLDEVYLASTGVIGAIPPLGKLAAVLPGAVASARPDGIEAAAHAIMTTDTFAKGAHATVTIDGKPVQIAGFCKGSGMIQPDMATMLAYVFTDAAIAAPVLQTLLKQAVDRTFNAITVDSDTSTSDTVLLAATGKAAHDPILLVTDRRLGAFRRGLETVLRDLAQQVVRDGEGAEKFIEIRVSGAVSSVSARKIGLAIANSPLVKTAIAASDANWGRIVAAIGKSGEPAERDHLSVAIGGIPIARGGGLVPDYDEAPVAAHMAGRLIHIAVDLGLGRGKAVVWTCDLTHRYIDINGSYRS